MQIHELNKRPTNVSEQQVNEVDLVGPQSIWNVGKQVLKNPKAWTDSAQLGAAKSAATQQHAADSAKKLAAKGYSTAGSATTPQQQYQTIKNNPGVQQQVKNLAAQWKTQGTALAARMKQAQQTQPAKTATTEAVHIANPSSIKDPKELQIYQAVLDQEAAKAAQTDPQAAQKAQAEVNQNLDEYAKEFQAWANTRLSNMGFRMADIEANPWAKSQLSSILLKIATLAQVNPGSAESTAAVEDYFNTVYATNIALEKSSGRRVGGGAATVPGQEEQQGPAEVLKQYGLQITSAQINDLAAAMTRAAQGGKVIKNTNNEVLNALAQLAGFQIGR